MLWSQRFKNLTNGTQLLSLVSDKWDQDHTSSGAHLLLSLTPLQ